MLVGAIRLDTLPAGAIEVNPGAGDGMSGGIDFAAALIAAGDGFIAGPADDKGPAAKTEMSRNVTVRGNLRETVISYTDGTSDIQTSVAIGDAPITAPNVSPAAARPIGPTFRANSDLAPEIGIGRNSSNAPPCRMPPVKRPSMAAAGRRSTGMSEETSVADTRHDIGVGRLIDLIA